MLTDGYYTAVGRLPQPWGGWLGALPAAQAAQVSTVRLRSGCPVGVTCGGANLFLTGSGRLAGRGSGLPVLTHDALQRCFVSLCGHSVFSYEDQLKQGFFTLPGGHRVGVAAQAVWRGDTLLQPKNVSSLALRIARPMPLQDAADWRRLLARPLPGILLAGVPGSGKTTVLRALAGLLSDMGRAVAVLDERCELFPLDADGFCFAQPWNCDVLSGLPKALAMQQALRALAPQVILCDELAAGDVPGLLGALNGGAGFVASIHAAGWAQLQSKPQLQQLLGAHALTDVVFLTGPDSPARMGECRHVGA